MSSNVANARQIENLKDSPAITTLSQFILDVSEDLNVTTQLSDKKFKLNDLSNCTVVSADDVLNDVELSFKRVLHFYPDEDISFEQSILDLRDYLDQQTFQKCSFVVKTKKSILKSIYYNDLNNKIYLRLDNLTLIAE
jgi:hypothetical protein